MGETQQAATVQDEWNPFDPQNHKDGGGLWDGKTITVTSSVAKTEALKRGDGSAVIDEKTKQPVIQSALYWTGIADGGDDKERREEYSVGDANVAAPDGRGFIDKATGKQASFSKSCNFSKLTAALKGSGFDIRTLVGPERDADGKLVQHVERLTGARFVMKGEPKLGQDGKPLKDKKGYTKTKHLPVKFVGYASGAGVTAAPAPAAGGNGHAAPASAPSALETKAVGAVTAALAAAGGQKVTRADLVRGLAQSLQGDPDANQVIGLVVQDSFHKGRPWQYDGTHASL